MATGGESFSHSIGSEDFYDIVCDPCQEDGELHKAVGMCIDCKDHLCQKCYDGHKIARPFRKHELLDKEAMLQGQVSIIKDKCTDKCTVHEDKIIEYYCINHSYLGCNVCITLDHRTCDSVRYIPHVAKDLANNEEYQNVESQLLSVVEKSKKVTKHNKHNTKSLKKGCSEAVEMVQKFRKDINEVLDQVESDLLQQCETIQSEETAKIAQIVDTFQTTQTELHALMDMKETFQNNKQNCNLYTLMMKTKDKVKLAEERMKEAEKEQSYINSQIKFIANTGTLNSLKSPETLGKLLTSGTSRTIRPEQTKTTVREKLSESPGRLLTSETSRTTRPEQTNATVKEKLPESPWILLTSETSRIIRSEQTKTTVREKLSESSGTVLTSETSRTIRPEQTYTTARQKKQTSRMKKTEIKLIVRAEYVQDINVQYKTDKHICYITGLVILPNNRLVTSDYYDNENVKLVDVKYSRVITCLTLSSEPFDVTMVTNSQVAITMPDDNKVAIVNVTATAMTVERTLDVDGACYGVDYRDGKLAVSYRNPDKVQVITLQGRVLHNITTDQQGHNLFNDPYYIVFGQDNTSLYVSNFNSHKVVKVKFDGTVVGTYTDSELRCPHALLTDSSGHVYVCGRSSRNIHQITPDCRKLQVLLTRADGLHGPLCISYSETDCRLYVGMWRNNVVKVYRVILGSN